MYWRKNVRDSWRKRRSAMIDRYCVVDVLADRSVAERHLFSSVVETNGNAFRIAMTLGAEFQLMILPL